MMTATPDWVSSLTEEIARHLVAAAVPAPIGVHVQRSDTPASTGPRPSTKRRAPREPVWEVSLFYGKTEVLGGAGDGKRTDTAFWLDLAAVTAAFTSVEGFFWQAAPLGPEDDLGPHVAVEGVYDGHRVRLRVLAAAPERFPSARAADTLNGTFVDLW